MAKVLPFDEQRRLINSQLHRCELIVVGKKLYIRAMFPPKQNSGPARRTSLKTGCIANMVGLRAAELKAREVDLDLLYDRFHWDKYLPAPPVPVVTGRDLVNRFKQHYWQRHADTADNRVSYLTNFGTFLERLPLDQPLSLDSVLQSIATTPPDSANRRSMCSALVSFGRFLEWSEKDLQQIRDLRGRYNHRSVQRYIPTDDEIYSVWQAAHTIPQETYDWPLLIATLAYTGCRPCELLTLDCAGLSADPPYVQVKSGKTGARQVFVFKSPLWSEIEYKPLVLPENWQNIGQKPKNQFTTYISQVFLRVLQLPWTPYGLRHAFAYRMYRAGIDTYAAARNMGHSEAVHRTVYSVWSAGAFAERFKQATQSFRP